MNPGRPEIIPPWLMGHDVEFDTRPLVQERMRLIRKGPQSILRVAKGRRSVPGFEGVTLEHAQVVEMVSRFERRVKELLLGLATADQAAKWWIGKTNGPIEQAGTWRGKT